MSPLSVIKYYALMKKAKVDIVFLCRLILQKIGLINWNGMGVMNSTLLAHLKIEKVSGIAQKVNSRYCFTQFSVFYLMVIVNKSGMT